MKNRMYKDSPYNKGVEAYKNNTPHTANPFEQLSEEYLEWNNGWWSFPDYVRKVKRNTVKLACIWVVLSLVIAIGFTTYHYLTR
jgi:hypothetical protein